MAGGRTISGSIAIYNADDLGYRGQPFNWVTMPDQFTLTAFERLEQSRPARAPLVAQIALVSSHAHGCRCRSFCRGMQSATGASLTHGPCPATRQRWSGAIIYRVRDQVPAAIDYSLETVGDGLRDKVTRHL